MLTGEPEAFRSPTPEERQAARIVADALAVDLRRMGHEVDVREIVNWTFEVRIIVHMMAKKP